ncbi:MAG: CsiV family protein [Steroidobacteraceae bacterium]
MSIRPPPRFGAWLLLACCALCAPLNASAATSGNRYRVEIIIFRTAMAASSEDWNAPPEGRGFDRGNTSGAPPQVLATLDADKLQMGGMASKLRNGGYRILAHTGWIQSATNWPAHLGLDLSAVGISVPGLTGQIYVERGTLLHMGVDLTLAGSPSYRLKELRRIKFNEKQYFDHPALGVIALVSPVGASAQ